MCGISWAQVSLKMSVAPAGGDACYVVVPCTYLPGQEAKFTISVSSSHPVVFEQITDTPRVTTLRVSPPQPTLSQRFYDTLWAAHQFSFSFFGRVCGMLPLGAA